MEIMELRGNAREPPATYTTYCGIVAYLKVPNAVLSTI